MLGIVLGLASSLAWGVSDILGGIQSRRLPVLSVLMISQPVGLVIGIVVALASGENPLSSGDAWIAIAGGAAGVIGLGCFYAAMAGGTISIVAPVASMGTVVPVAVGLARGEDPATLQLAGLAVALLGIALAVREAERPDAAPAPGRSVALAAFAGLCFGSFFVGMDIASDTDAIWATAFARVGEAGLIAIAVVVAALASPGRIRFSRAALPVLLAIGVLDILANTLFAFASREGLLSLVAVASSLYPVTTVLLARFMLNERLASLQKVGVSMALVGVVMLAAGA